MVIRRRNKGFTLIEMSISTMILCVASLALGALLVQGIRGWSRGVAQDSATGGVTIALQKLSMDIRDGVSATASSGVLTVRFPSKITDAATGETIYDPAGTSTTTRYYFISNGNLVRNAGGVYTIIGRGVTWASFGASAGSVTLTLQSTDKLGSGEARHFQVNGRVNLRNYRS